MAVSKDLPGSHQAQVHSTSAEGFNTRELRSALGSFATGVTIITTRDRDGTPHGMTANSFSSVSLNPPLVLWSSSLYAQSLPPLQESPHFCVNILAYDQIELSNKFAKQADDKFIDVDHIIPESGAPVITGAAAHFECRNEFRHYGGDHIIFIGHVERFAYTDKPTLMFCRGQYIRGEPILQSQVVGNRNAPSLRAIPAQAGSNCRDGSRPAPG